MTRAQRLARDRMLERERIMAALTPQTVADKIGFYRTEKAKAMERWSLEGGPSCGFTSGRHPVCYGRGYPG